MRQPPLGVPRTIISYLNIQALKMKSFSTHGLDGGGARHDGWGGGDGRGRKSENGMIPRGKNGPMGEPGNRS